MGESAESEAGNYEGFVAQASRLFGGLWTGVPAGPDRTGRPCDAHLQARCLCHSHNQRDAASVSHLQET